MTERAAASRPGGDWPRVGSFSFHLLEDRWEWSDEVARMHGYEPGTVSPTTELVLSHKHPDDKPTVAELIEQVRRHAAPFSSRHRIIDTAGNVHVVVVVGDRSYDPAGQPIGTSGFYVDITDEFDADLQDSVNQMVATIDESRAAINRAVGILMLTHGVSADRAFDVLAWRSKQTNVKLRTIATRFVAAVAAISPLSSNERNQIDHLLLTAHEESAAG